MADEQQSPSCTVPGCGRPLYQSRVYCGAHRSRYYRWGDPLATAPARRADLTDQRFGMLVVLEYSSTKASSWRCRCDCGAETTVRGWSLTSGDTTSCGRKRRHLPPALSYSDMHFRLRIQRGRASRQVCARCGRRAKHWAYRQTGATQRLEAPEGPWSTNPDDYLPLCVSCHKRIDLGEIARRRAAAHGAIPLWDEP